MPQSSERPITVQDFSLAFAHCFIGVPELFKERGQQLTAASLRFAGSSIGRFAFDAHS